MSFAWFGFIRRMATALGAGSAKDKRKSVLRTAAVVMGLVREYKIDTLESIERAVVEEVQGEARQVQADARFREAEAAERQAKAALTQAEATLIISKANALDRESVATVESIKTKAVVDAVERLTAAVSKLRQKGGSVVVIETEISNLLRRGKQEFPDEKLIAEAQKDLQSSGAQD